MKKKIIIIAILLGFWTGMIGWFFSNYRIRSPIEKVVRTPVSESRLNIPKNKQEIALPAVLAQDSTSDTINPEIEEIIAKIRVLESGNCNAVQGYHRVCENKGLRNCVGYGVHSDFCFNDKEDETKTLSKLLKEELAKKPLEEVLCEYNLGPNAPKKELENCTYYQDFNELNL